MTEQFPVGKRFTRLYVWAAFLVPLLPLVAHASPAEVKFGSVIFTASSNLIIELAGTTPGDEYDTLTGTGTATLNGTLDIDLLGGFVPAPGNSFQFITAAGGVVGTFSNVLLPSISNSSWHLDYNPNSVVLQVGLLGDYNLNGTVDAADYVIWRKTLGQTGFALAADGNNNNQIDTGDFNIWRANFGNTAGSGSAHASASHPTVPEPGTFFIAATALLWLALLRRTVA